MTMKSSKLSVLVLMSLLPVFALAGTGSQIIVVEKPLGEPGNRFYAGNRAPLHASGFVKLPPGAVQPKGWIRKQLEIETEGFTGHLDEISQWLKKDGNAWLDPNGQGHSGWEELPYWLKGYSNLGYVLGDAGIIAEARVWIEGILSTGRENGYFGPQDNLTPSSGPAGKPDLWPNMVALFILQDYYDYSGDKRVLKLMSDYFKWELGLKDEDFVPSSWQNQRAGDNLYSVYWLYNRTGDKWLLELGDKVFGNMARWSAGIASVHGVNIAQCFRSPTVYWQQSGDARHLVQGYRNYDKVMDSFGQFPGGMYGADENCRRGYYDPRQAAETCSMVEMMRSCEILLGVTGDAVWADRCEDVAFNSLPASMTADMKALRYLTAPNMVISDAANKSPGLQNGGPMLLYNPHDHRCCQHNSAHGWPYFAEHLWMATGDNGLAAVMYGPSEVTAKAAQGSEVTIVEKTAYPFDGEIMLEVASEKDADFPLYLRVPKWCGSPKITINDETAFTDGKAGSYVMIKRLWSKGDRVTVVLPMEITLRKWEKNNNSVSVDRGPLTYSLKIGEKYVRNGGTDKWPAWEIYPTTAWNYGLVPGGTPVVVRKEIPEDALPWGHDSSPIELTVKAQKIPAWKADDTGLVGTLQASPALSNEPVETITLIPMGCARLRISAFPTVGSGPDAHEWK
jgi:hypothetical protein